MEKMPGIPPRAEQKTESLLNQKIKKLQLLAALVGSLFMAQGVAGQSSAEEILSSANKIELPQADVEKIEGLHYTIDSLIQVLEKQVRRNNLGEEIELSIYGEKISKQARLRKYENSTVGKDKDFLHFSLHTDSTNFSYGSNPKNGFSILKGAEISFYRSKDKTLFMEGEEGVSEFEKELENIKTAVGRYVEETKK